MRNVTQYGISAIAVGAYFSIAIRDGRVYIWVKYDVGQCTVPRYLQRITQISLLKEITSSPCAAMAPSCKGSLVIRRMCLSISAQLYNDNVAPGTL